LKALTRGRRVDQASLHAFIDAQKLPESEKRRLKSMTPASYVGNAAAQALAVGDV
jgi:adenylosuccinate lyase